MDQISCWPSVVFLCTFIWKFHICFRKTILTKQPFLIDAIGELLNHTKWPVLDQPFLLLSYWSRGKGSLFFNSIESYHHINHNFHRKLTSFSGNCRKFRVLQNQFSSISNFIDRFSKIHATQHFLSHDRISYTCFFEMLIYIILNSILLLSFLKGSFVLQI